MARPKAVAFLAEPRRRLVFQAIVRLQDQHCCVPKIRQVIARDYHVTEMQVAAIEEEGVAMEWPTR